MDIFVDKNNENTIQHDQTVSLLQTSGHPKNWNQSNVNIPGLYHNGKISSKKFLKFSNISTSKQKTLLRTQEFYITIVYLNGTTATFQGKNLSESSQSNFKGKLPENSSVYTSRKIAVLNNTRKRVQLRYYSWEN